MHGVHIASVQFRAARLIQRKCFLGFMIDFKKKLEEEENINNNDLSKEDVFAIKRKRKISNTTIFIVVIVLLFSSQVIFSSSDNHSWFDDFNLFSKIKHLAPSLDKKLAGENNDRINVLLLGMGGEGHDGGSLTDTMMLASFKPSIHEASLISFPRDLVSPVSNWQKINSINAYAEAANPGSGGEKTKNSLAELLQTDIHYYVRVDFSAFEKIIDEIGGVEIAVENSFTDYQYPILGREDNPDYYSRFETLSFKAGKQKMNGKTALKYARSRHAAGVEGSDYARARRQQLLIEAVKNKLLSAGTLLNPVTLTKLINEFNKNVSTNLEVWEILRLWELGKNIERENIINFVLNDAPDNYLISSRGEDGAFILLPRSGNFNDIRSLVKNIFPEENLVSEKKTSSIETISGTSTLVVLNGTWIAGLAGRKSALAKQSGFEIIEVANAPERNYEESIIYDLSSGEKKKELKSLENLLGAKSSKSIPDWLVNYQVSSSTPDLVLILGTNADTQY